MPLIRFYYDLKPLLPASVRLTVRRYFALRKRERVQGLWPILPGSEIPPAGWTGWPQGKQFAFVLTHDVESRKGLEKVQQLAELEMSLGFRSSFNLIPEGPYQVDLSLVKWLRERGFEVGVHDHRHDGKLYRSERGFQDSAKRINHFLKEWQAVGFRSGFMLRNLEWIHDLEVLYDASTFDTDPFEPQPDGADTIFPFVVNRANRPGYVELPYTLAQDSTLFLVLRERTTDVWKRKLEWVATHGGMALMNVHPDYIAFGQGKPKYKEFPLAHYADFLRWVKQKYQDSGWFALPAEVARFTRERLGDAARKTFLAPGTPRDFILRQGRGI